MIRRIAGATRLCAFDLRRHRGLFAIVVLLEAGRGALAEAALRWPSAQAGDVADVPGALGRISVGALDAGLWLLALIVVAVLVQTDHPSDDRAFWRTRPIPPGALAAAKIATLALVLVVVPATITTLRLAAYAAPLASVAAVWVQFAVLAGFAVVPAWPLALATRTVPRFVAVALVVPVVALFAWARFADHSEGYTVHSDWRFGVPLPVFDWRRHDLYGWWTGLAFVGAGLGLIWAHYVVRQAARAVPAGLALLAALVAWPMPPASAGAAPGPLARIVAGRLELPAGIVRPWPSSVEAARNDGSETWLQAGIAIPGLPRDIGFAVHLGPVRITTPRGSVVGRGTTQHFRGHSPEAVVAPGTTGFPHHMMATFQGGSIAEIWPHEAAVLDAPHASVDADAIVDLTRHRLAGVLPLLPGAALRTDRYRLEVLAASGQPRRVVVHLVRFPRLSRADEQRLWLFGSDDTRTTVGFVGWEGWHTASDVLDGFERPGWANGRTWAGRFAFPYLFIGKNVAATRLLIVESHPAGQVRTRLALRDVPVSAQR